MLTPKPANNSIQYGFLQAFSYTPRDYFVFILFLINPHPPITNLYILIFFSNYSIQDLIDWEILHITWLLLMADD